MNQITVKSLTFRIRTFRKFFAFFFREAQTTKIMMSAGVFLTYPLVMYPAVEILLPSILKWSCFKHMDVATELGFRYLLVLITCKQVKFLMNSLSHH